MLEFSIVLILFIGLFTFMWYAGNKDDKPTITTKEQTPKPTLEFEKSKQPIEPEKPNEPVINEPKKEHIKSSYILTYHEQAMFKLLKQALPNYHIFVQVSFSAILWTPDQATRNRFNRKIADFVITCENFLIKAIIELDDVSHIGREQQDAERDQFLKTAGYKVIRYKQLPTIEQIKNDMI